MVCKLHSFRVVVSIILFTIGSAEGVADVFMTHVVPEGRELTRDEVTEILNSTDEFLWKNNKKLNLPSAEISTLTLGTSSALSSCTINFNSSFSLGLMYHQAYHTFVTWPYYIHGCNGNNYWVYSKPRNIDHFHLIPEFEGYCIGQEYKIGMQFGDSCLFQSDAKNWPRVAANMGSNSGVEFYVRSNAGNLSKNFNLNSIVVKSGVARVTVYRTDINKWWTWKNLGVGTWVWSVNNTSLSSLRLYNTDKNGTISFDNVKINILP